jgi:acetate kinase
MKESSMKSTEARILTINGGSSSIKFALYAAVKPLRRRLHGKVDRIGLSGTNLTFHDADGEPPASRKLAATDHKSTANSLIDWLEARPDFASVKAVGHRVVHGMKHTEPEIVTKKLLDELHRISPNDPDHLPGEIELIETFRRRHPKLPQVACFDTAFHQTMPRVAKLLPLPRRFDAKGIQRYGFHGLSYAYLVEELARLGDPAATKGRVILAHLGNGASMAAVRDGKSIDTSMCFTPTAGLVMSTRTGDLDPGLAPYLARTEQMTIRQFYEMVNHKSGLLGVSETSIMKPTQLLHNLGQSLWLDNITRDLLNSGTLKRYIDELSVTGLTSNPTIFDHALKNSAAYDAAIREESGEGENRRGLFFDLALDDLTRAADLFRPVHDRTNGVDGWVSLEVSPLLAHDTVSTIAAAKELSARAGRPNLFIKIPGTKEGAPAIEEAIFAGVPVNVTLLFSREHYVAAAEAYLRGIERRIAAGLNPSGRLRGLDIHQPLGRRRGGQGSGGVAEPARHRHFRSHLQGVPRPVEQPALAARLQCRRPAATTALGQHRHQGSEGVRHPLRQGAGRSVHGEHDARGHVEGARRSWRNWPDHGGERRWLRKSFGRVCPGRRERGRPGRAPSGRGRKVVCEILERIAGGDCGQERRAQAGRLTGS